MVLPLLFQEARFGRLEPVYLGYPFVYIIKTVYETQFLGAWCLMLLTELLVVILKRLSSFMRRNVLFLVGCVVWTLVSPSDAARQRFHAPIVKNVVGRFVNSNPTVTGHSQHNGICSLRSESITVGGNS